MSSDFEIQRQRPKPVKYRVDIRHEEIGDEWILEMSAHTFSNVNEVQKKSIANDLRFLADLLETREWKG